MGREAQSMGLSAQRLRAAGDNQSAQEFEYRKTVLIEQQKEMLAKSTQAAEQAKSIQNGLAWYSHAARAAAQQAIYSTTPSDVPQVALPAGV